MAFLTERFTQDALDEVFPRPAIREVAFEIRFAPRLRVNAELWRLQDQLVEDYPGIGSESVFLHPGAGVINVSVFQNPSTGRVIKVSQENFLIAFTSYTQFEDFKAEVLSRVEKFCSTFEISSLTRSGLRYVNNIVVPALGDTASLLRFVQPFMDFERLDVGSIDQFVTEVRMRFAGHMVTVRGALLPALEDRRRAYVLDIDCHNDVQQSAKSVDAVLDTYHDTAQRFFLDHITEEYKHVMRGKQ